MSLKEVQGFLHRLQNVVLTLELVYFNAEIKQKITNRIIKNNILESFLENFKREIGFVLEKLNLILEEGGGSKELVRGVDLTVVAQILPMLGTPNRPFNTTEVAVMVNKFQIKIIKKF